MNSPMLDVAVIIVSWNVRSYLADCLRSVFNEFRRTKVSGQVWVIDNNSTDGSPELVQDLFPQVHLISNDSNPGFGSANNQGMAAAAPSQPRYYFLLNPDTLVRPGAIRALVDFMDNNPRAGMAGARLVYGDGRFQHSAFAFPRIAQLLFDLFPFPPRLYETRVNGRYPRWYYTTNTKPFLVDFPLGATMMVRRDVAEQTSGFDPEFFMYCEELDWCMRIRKAGWHIYTVPTAEIVHYGGQSTMQVQARSLINLWDSRAKFYRRHHGPLTNAIARQLVSWGMTRKVRQTKEADLRQAYQQITTIWQK
jgi:N-acetylglucosaminyl-diphospho-decaprenol L-rhamnosyltransferase